MSEIKALFPTNIGRFFEPFVGGGSVFMNVSAKEFFLNDIDSYVISIHKMLCSYLGRQDVFFDDMFKIIKNYHLSLSYLKNEIPDELKQNYPKTYFAKYNKQSYSEMKNDFNIGNQQNMLMLYVLLIYGFNRMLRFNKKGDFNLPVGDVDFNQNTYNALEDYFMLLNDKKVNWYNEDFRVFLGHFDFQDDDLIYLDPPYLITSSEYNKLWNDETERDLLSILDDLNCRGIRFAISNVTHYRGKINNRFLEWSDKYKSFPIKSNYISFNDNTIKQFNEVLVINY